MIYNTCFISLGSKGIVVYRTLPSLYGSSLEIMQTVPFQADVWFGLVWFGLVWFGLPKIVLFPYCDKNQYNLIHFWKAHGLYFNNLQKIGNKQNCKFLLKYQVINLFVVLGVNVDLLILMDQLSNKNRKTIYSSSAPPPPPLQCPKTVLH